MAYAAKPRFPGDWAKLQRHSCPHFNCSLAVNEPSAMSHTYTRLSLLTKHLSNGKVRVLMLILSEFDIRFQVPAPAAMVVVLHLHPSIESRLRTGNELLIERSTTDVPDPTTIREQLFRTANTLILSAIGVLVLSPAPGTSGFPTLV